MPANGRAPESGLKLSIIVVTWNNENFIEQALRSCIDQSVDGYEVVVVHNASTDRTGEMIRRATAGHEHLFTIIENERNEGLGEGRNIGMRHARGESLMFLDGDDWYAEGAISRAHQLGQMDADLAIFDHVYFHTDSHLEANTNAALLMEGYRITGEQRSMLLRNFGVAWNKIYSRAFLDAFIQPFPRLLYEDIFWNVQCIMQARSIYVTSDTLVFYRQRQGSLLRSCSESHFDSFIQHDRIVDFLEHNPQLVQSFGQALRRYTEHQLFATVNVGGRVPPGAEGRFLRRVSRVLRRYDDLGVKRRGNYRAWVAGLGLFSLYQGYRSLGKFLRSFQSHRPMSGNTID